ncbi:hypothetical protein GCM10010256_16400 [Streptomyces coeruleorubidus]|nr:hypothetical protein GCM10010256_16400 [Streptomyces coeruleorubidus]
MDPPNGPCCACSGADALRRSSDRNSRNDFTGERQLGGEAAGRLIAADRQGAHAFRLVEPVEELWAAYRARMPELVRCDPRVLDGL